jgi:hypothetical protein
VMMSKYAAVHAEAEAYFERLRTSGPIIYRGKTTTDPWGQSPTMVAVEGRMQADVSGSGFLNLEHAA